MGKLKEGLEDFVNNSNDHDSTDHSSTKMKLKKQFREVVEPFHY